MPIDTELLHSIAAHVHQSQPMPLPSGEIKPCIVRLYAGQTRLAAREAHLAIDQVAARKRHDWSTFLERPHQPADVGHVVFAIELRQHDRSEIDIARITGWSVDYLCQLSALPTKPIL